MLSPEVIVYLARNFHWSLAELLPWTKGDIGRLTSEQLGEIIIELQYQEALESYRADHRSASIMAMIGNTTPSKNHRQYKASDFCGQPPQRPGESSIFDKAKAKGLKVPQLELKEVE